MNVTTLRTTLRMNRTRILRWAGIGKLLLAGALFGIALLNTAHLVIGTQPTDSAEKLSMGIGAAVFAALLKLAHIV